jgi:glycine dehydrogenase subunit 2
MGMDLNTKIRKFHQAKWDEPIIFELNSPGERGILLPKIEQKIKDKVGDATINIPVNMRRQKAPALPELSQMQVLKHYLRLSQENLGADLNIDIGQGTCTMKYNPKINEQLARLPKVAKLHPAQDESTVQGMLEIIYQMDNCLRAISGLNQFSFQAGGGSQAILGMTSVVDAYFKEKGEHEQRNEIITTIFSHPSDVAAATTLGYKVITLYHDSNGLPSLEALKAALSEKTAAVFITNPEDTGIFNSHIKEFTDAAHGVGAICGYDQANANGIIGITRAKEAGFDMCFFNLHKTFSTPHGCGGPGCGGLGVVENLIPYMPKPLVKYDGQKYFLDHDMPQSFGKIRSYVGVSGAILKAYSWVMSLGAEGLKEVARVAVLNNNYMLKKINQIKGASAPFQEGEWRIEQARYSWEELSKDTGISTEDITCRMADFGLHLWSSHHPFVVPEPFTVEPTESYAKAELDEYLAVLEKIAQEAYENPEVIKTAPHNSVIHRPGHGTLDDPEKWAVTWRAYKKKHLQNSK